MSNETLPVKADELDALDLQSHLPATVAGPLDLLRKTTATLDDLVDLNPEDLDGQARVNELIDILVRDLRTIQDKVKGHMHAAAPGYRFTVEGVGTYQRCKAGEKNVWDDEAAMKKVLELSGGEFGEFLDLIKKCARFSWRSTPFKDAGVNPVEDGLVDKQGGRDSVRRVSETKR